MSRTISAGYVYRQYSTEGVYLADYKSSREAHEAIRGIHWLHSQGGSW